MLLIPKVSILSEQIFTCYTVFSHSDVSFDRKYRGKENGALYNFNNLNFANTSHIIYPPLGVRELTLS